MSETPNTTLAHYTILSKLGAGGMGEVYLAQDTKLDRKVAIKFLNEEFSREGDKLKRFVQEAKAASALGEKDKAFAELNKALENREWQLLYVKIDPRIEPLRDDPRYQELIHRMRFPE